MFEKIVKIIFLVLLTALYAVNVYGNLDDLYGAVVLNRVNFVLLVLILYLLSDFVKACENWWIFVLVAGLLFHGYMYYVAYNNERPGAAQQSQMEKCSGEGSTWYSKLNNRCY